jgi:RNA polymerase-binding transcription factor DksA
MKASANHAGAQRGIRPQRRKAASSAALLTSPGPTTPPWRGVRIRPEWVRPRRQLLELRARLLAEQRSLARDAAEALTHPGTEMADAATDEFDHAAALRTLSAAQEALYEIEAALHRIEAGTYGVCELTGQRIPPARLRAVPWTRFTRDAEAQLERAGALARTHLPPPASVRMDADTALAEEAADAETPAEDELLFPFSAPPGTSPRGVKSATAASGKRPPAPRRSHRKERHP